MWSCHCACSLRHRLSTALLHRQARLRTIERLNLAFLVDAEHDCLVGWIEVEPDNVDYFLSEFVTAQVGRQRGSAKNSLDGETGSDSSIG